jgi:hypothetical protein
MTEAEENFAYWTRVHAEELMNGRDPCDTGMSYMRRQMDKWKEVAEAERVNQQTVELTPPTPEEQGYLDGLQKVVNQQSTRD